MIRSGLGFKQSSLDRATRALQVSSLIDSDLLPCFRHAMVPRAFRP